MTLEYGEDKIMAFTDSQVRQLKAKLDPRYIKTRSANGANLNYVEGWHAIAEANRIFGFDAWDRRTVATACVWSGASGQYHAAAYTAKVRVSVRAGEITIVREGSGTGEGRASTPGQAHDLALKGAETDATKRALATFGNPFGLALYDREQVGVRKVRGSFNGQVGDSSQSGPWVLRSSSGKPLSSHDTTRSFIEALKQAMREADDIELLYDVWEANIETLRLIHRSANERPGVVPTMVSHLRACAVDLVKQASNGSAHQRRSGNGAARPKIDKSVLAISEPKRIRSKEHLRFVASQPCLICGRSPSHAHHIRYSQSRGLSLKVSDEFTVPLCAIHHHQIHTTGKEREWWEERNMDPLKVAMSLWQHSRDRYSAIAEPARYEIGVSPEPSEANEKSGVTAVASVPDSNTSREP
jgi:DNA recombination protein Rad52